MLRSNNPASKARRQAEAKSRQAEYDKLTLAQKLEKLNDTVRYVGGTASKQRARLELELARSGVAIEPVSANKAKRVKAKDRRASGNKLETEE